MYKYLEKIPNKFLVFFTIGVSLLLGGFVRYPYLVSEDNFPLGDGGLFVAMINAIKANRFMLPAYVSFNGYQIPFAYPPLGFYLVIITSRLLGLPTLLVARYLPIVLNLCTLIVFVLLACKILKDKPTILIASMIFPVILQVYLWTIKGGGISRSPGFLFTILSIYLIFLYEERTQIYYLFAAILSLSAAILSHPEWAVVAVTSIAIYFISKSHRSWVQRIQMMLSIYIGAAILTAPWWGMILFRLGVSPIRMAGQAAKMDIYQIIENFLDGRMLSVHITLTQGYLIPFLAMMGFMITLYKKDFFLPFWLVSAYFVAPKNSPIPGIVPLILLSAIGLRSIDVILLSGLQFLKKGHGLLIRLFDCIVRVFSLIPLSSVYLIIVIPFSLVNLIKQPILHPIRQSDRAAMQYIAGNTPQNARFVVLTPADWFEADSVEWFPLLADRQSLTTPQGLEWVSSSQFLNISAVSYELSSLVRQALAGNDSGEIVRYVEAKFEEFEYVAVFGNDLTGEFGGFVESGRFEVVYFKNNVLIFVRTLQQNNE